jgi:hypothetical protein
VKRREDESGIAVPPPGLLDYRAWCRERGLAPFGHTADLASMRAAVAQWDVWERLRREWASAHGVDEDDPVLDWHGSAPFDWDAI